MKTKHLFFPILSLMLSISFGLQAGGIKHAKTQSLKVSGNCGMCKKTIETAANRKGSVNAAWDENKHLLTLTYDSTKTTPEEVLKRVAYAGYDNEKFLAPDEVYSMLHGCCQYERTALAKVGEMKTAKKEEAMAGMPVMDMGHQKEASVSGTVSPLGAVFDAYFGLKDALAKDDGTLASSKAKELFKAIDKVAMDKMTATQHSLWMKLEKAVSYDAEHIKGVDETEHQREHFVTLSKNMFELAKAFKIDAPVYYDFCPMANNGKGANWLSLEEKINNPYMGKAMPTCGKVQEVIK